VSSPGRSIRHPLPKAAIEERAVYGLLDRTTDRLFGRLGPAAPVRVRHRGDPDHVFLDEPTVAMDARCVARSDRDMRRYRRRGSN
jgi:hypothetical protein